MKFFLKMETDMIFQFTKFGFYILTEKQIHCISHIFLFSKTDA